MTEGPPLDASYVLPLRWSDDEGLDELTEYLRPLARWLEVVVVDGSGEALYARHADAWRGFVTHLAPDPALRTAMGKVGGVLTGVRAAAHDPVVIADDDVRWDRAGLERALGLLEQAELVRPQNYFDPRPWHASWDTGRTLLNRALGADFPGTLVVRRSFLLDIGGYAGDVMFENLELMRTVEAAGGRVHDAPALFVRRLPPSARHFGSQRVRQAYDDFALPARMALFLALGPAVLLAPRRLRSQVLAAGAFACVALAEHGRRRSEGRRVFPPTAPLWAPLWVAERAVCSWLAVGSRLLRGGIPYGGGLIRRSATPMAELRRRLASPRPRHRSERET